MARHCCQHSTNLATCEARLFGRTSESLLMTLAPIQVTYAPHAMVVTVDGLATSAALAVLHDGGSAVDAAIAANAVLAVTLPNQCGVGGDLFALVHRPGVPPQVVEAVGRAGSGADVEALRRRGLTAIPPHEIASVTIPGCVDGWVALHERYGRLALADLMRPAIDYAQNGFPATPFVANTISGRSAVGEFIEGAGGPVAAGQTLYRRQFAGILRDIAEGGRDAFYCGAFGAAMRRLGPELFAAEDFRKSQASWTRPLGMEVFGQRIWTPQPPSSGYLTLSAAWIAERAGLPASPTDPAWPHVLIEAMRQAAFDRPEVLSDAADGQALISRDRLSDRVGGVRRDGVANLTGSYRPGGTTYVSVVDAERTAVSLIQSNCMSFGSRLVAPGTGVWLHNRGIGFNLRQGHPNCLAPNRRPAHTLAPVIVTDQNDDLIASLGTRGGDSQPQVVVQLLARLLRAGESPATALSAGRWILRGKEDDTSFNTWGFGGDVRVCLEANTPGEWSSHLGGLGHRVEIEPAFSHAFGHAHIIEANGNVLQACADPRSGSAAAAGY